MSLDKFIYRLKNDEDATRQRLLRHEVLAAEPIRQRRRKRYLLADKHLLALAQRYAAHYRANGDILRYLRCVQYHLQKPRFPGEPADVDEDPLEDVADDGDGGDDNEGAVPEEGGGRIPRRESHPGDHHGFEPEENERNGGHVGGLDNGADANGGAAEAAGGRQGNVVDEPLPGLSQAEVVNNRQPPVHWGPVPLPSQTPSTSAVSAFAHRPSSSALPASRREPVRLATFNALSGYGCR